MNSVLRTGLLVFKLLLLSVVNQGAPGELKWTFPTGGAIRSSPAVGKNGLVYFGSIDGNVFAVDANSGVERWRYNQEQPIHSSPAIAENGSVIIASASTLLALGGETGAPLWMQHYPGGLYSSPAVGTNGLVYIARFSYAGFIGVDLATGMQQWGAYPIEADKVYASPSIGADGTVYCGMGSVRFGNGPTFYAFNPNGGIKWTFRAGNMVQATPAIGSDGTVYIPSYDKLLYALDGQTGTQKWSHLLGDSISSSPALGPDNALYVGSNDGRLYSLNVADGTERWNFLTGDTIHSSPALAADGTVYFGSQDKRVYALDARDGALKWSYRTEGLVLSSPAISNDGTIFIGSMDGKLYAIEGSSAQAASAWPSFKAGMRATISDSPRLMGISVSPSDAAVVIRTISGKVHHLESKRDLDQTEWREVLNFTGSGWDESLRHPQPPTDQLFYRVRLGP